MIEEIGYMDFHSRYAVDNHQMQLIFKNKANVIKAKNRKDHEEVALKFVKIEERFRSTYLNSFCEYVKLNHPNLIRYKSMLKCKDDFLPFTFFEEMEYANYGTLADYLKVPRSFAQIVNIIRQSLEGYMHLHKFGILHRDIKATNILINLDQGKFIAKISDVEFWQSQENETLRLTPEFLAPEVGSYADYTIEAEIWAIGVMLYEIFTGEYPFGSRLQNHSISQINQNANNVNPSSFQNIPHPFQNIVKKCLNKNPLYRFNSIESIIQELCPRSLLISVIKNRIYHLQ